MGIPERGRYKTAPAVPAGKQISNAGNYEYAEKDPGYAAKLGAYQHEEGTSFGSQ